MKNILYSLLALFFIHNTIFAQLMSDQAHKAMMDTYTLNLNSILTANCPAGKSITQYKKDIINGINIPSASVQNSLINNALPLKNYGGQFATANGLYAPNDNYKYFYGAFNPSTIIKNGKLNLSGPIASQMWSCAFSNFITDNCGSSAVTSSKNDLAALAGSSINQVTQNSSRGYEILMIIGAFSDCIYNNMGHRLGNPYATANMQTAFTYIKSKMDPSLLASISNFSIKTSHLYVKIEPKDELEENQLLNDTLQEFSDYPLDYQFPEDNEEEVSVVDENGIGTYYAAVPVGYVFPTGIKTTLLDELYIPEEDPYFNNMVEDGEYTPDIIINMEDVFNSLLLRAFTQTGNQAEWDWQIQQSSENGISNYAIGGWRLSASKWYPTGNIKVHDNTIGRDVNLVGVKVYVRHWFRTRTGITDTNGYYHTMGIRGKSKYFIKWKRYEFALREGLFGLAKTGGPKLRNEQWNINFGSDEISSQDRERNRYFATVFQAAHDYYYLSDSEIHDLPRPPKNSWNNVQLKIGVRDTSGRSVTIPQIGTAGIFPTVYILEKGSSSEKMYGTTIHELTHAAHNAIPLSNFQTLEWFAYMSPEAIANLVTGNMSTKQRGCGKIMESWAECVETVLTNDRYINRLSQSDYKYLQSINDENYQNEFYDMSIQKDRNNFYTSALYDLYDKFNQWDKINSSLPNDNVGGFTLPEILDVVLHSSSWEDPSSGNFGFKFNCKQSATKNHPEINLHDIDVLLDYWN